MSYSKCQDCGRRTLDPESSDEVCSECADARAYYKEHPAERKPIRLRDVVVGVGWLGVSLVRLVLDEVMVDRG